MKELLAAHADGERSPEVEAHVRSCAACAEELARATADAERLRRALACDRPSPGEVQAVQSAVVGQAPRGGTSAGRLRRWRLAAAVVLAVTAGVLARIPGAEHASYAAAEIYAADAWAGDAGLVGATRVLAEGQSLTTGLLQYAHLDFGRRGDHWRVLPGTTVRMAGGLWLDEGALELVRVRPGGADLRVKSGVLHGLLPGRIVVHGIGIDVFPADGAREVNAPEMEATDDADLRVHPVGERGADGMPALVVGLDAWRDGDWRLAADELQEAEAILRDAQQAATAAFYRAAALGRAGDDAESLLAWRRFLDRWPGHEHVGYAQYFVAVCLERLGRADEAREQYRQVATAADGGDLVALARARLADWQAPNAAATGWSAFLQCYHAQDFAGALRALDRPDAPAELTDPEHGGEAAFYRWVCLGRLERTGEAVVAIDEFLTRFPRHPARDYALYFRAVYLLRLGRTAEARAAVQRLSAEFPASDLRPLAEGLIQER